MFMCIIDVRYAIYFRIFVYCMDFPISMNKEIQNCGQVCNKFKTKQSFSMGQQLDVSSSQAEQLAKV